MITTETNSRALATIGEEISHELGAKMVKDFQDMYPAENPWVFIGKGIIEQILAQPGCAGIRFYNALDEVGQKTLVYVGLNKSGEIITQYSSINADGKIQRLSGIVADRGGKPGTIKETITTTTDTWF